MACFLVSIASDACRLQLIGAVCKTDILLLVPLQDTGLEQEANDAAARVAGVGGDREDRYILPVLQFACMA